MNETVKEQEEELEEEKLCCVFYEDMTCPVRVEMHKQVSAEAIARRMLPANKGSDEQQMITKMIDGYKGLIEKFMGEFNELPHYCQLCPIKAKKDTEAYNEGLRKEVEKMRDLRIQYEKELFGAKAAAHGMVQTSEGLKIKQLKGETSEKPDDSHGQA